MIRQIFTINGKKFWDFEYFRSKKMEIQYLKEGECLLCVNMFFLQEWAIKRECKKSKMARAEDRDRNMLLCREHYAAHLNRAKSFRARFSYLCRGCQHRYRMVGKEFCSSCGDDFE